MAKIGDAIIYYSKQLNVNHQIIAAIVWQESRCEPYAMRFEPGFYAKYVKDTTYAKLQGFLPPSQVVTQETERKARATSWGLMQIMGQVAREEGFKELYLAELVDIETNIRFGAKHFSKLLDAVNGKIDAALLRWNGGGNKDYPAQVLNHIDTGDYQAVYVR